MTMENEPTNGVNGSTTATVTSNPNTGSKPKSRPRKRARKSIAKPAQEAITRRQTLFAPFRALGFVTNHVPFAVQVHNSPSSKSQTGGPRIHIVTCLGRAWALWEGEKMGLLFVGTEVEDAISSIALTGDAVWAASGQQVIKFVRGKPVSRLDNPFGTPLSVISLFGSNVLGLTSNGRHLIIWDLSEKTPSKQISHITFDGDFTATHILHPATYINKILIGSSEGGLQLWNISTRSCIHRFDSSNLHSKNIPSPITALVQSPAVDVIGIGFASGEVSIYDIRADERLLTVNMGAGISITGDAGRITAVGFRSDGEPILATASSTGHIAFWDLNANGRLLNVYRGAHDGAVTALEWIPGQPLLLSSGDDNSVKQWLFDSPTASPRLLKFRGGHQVPPHLIRYYGTDGKSILTASRDRSLRCTSVVRDSRSFELSQGSLTKKSNSLSVPLSHFKFPPVTSLSFSSTRSKDWEDVVTAHTHTGTAFTSDPSSSSSSFARTWSVQNKRLGRWTLQLGRDDRTNQIAKNAPKSNAVDAEVGSVRSVFVTQCGNFGLIGSSKGLVWMWNMQSGIRRREFDCEVLTTPDQDGDDEDRGKRSKGKGKGKETRRERPVSGVVVDSLNRTLVASTLDGVLHFFDFHTTKLEHTVNIPSSIVSITINQDNGIIAVLCDDMVVRLVDIETRRIVRELKGFRGRVLDLTFSPDGRWLITTSLDSLIRTFDIPTGRLVDAFKTASVATSVTFSPTGDFLATAHVDSVGVYLWANRAQYAEVSLQTFVEEEQTNSVALPTVQGAVEDEALGGLSELLPETNLDVYSTPDQLGEELITLTLLPRSRWQTLLSLETIAQRNKPKEAPKAPEKAPFFLPTLPGVEHRFAVEDKTKKSDKPTKRVDLSKVALQSEFVSKLADENEEGDYSSLFNYMKLLSPAAIDLELRSLSTSTSLLGAFIRALTARLRTHRDFEAVQTFITVFLRLHGDVIVQDEELREALEQLEEVQKKESERVLELIASSLGTLSFVREMV